MLTIVLFFGDDFRGHIQGSTTKFACRKSFWVFNEDWIPEVNEEDLALVVDDHIVQFNVAVGHLTRMANLKRPGNIEKDL